MQYKLSWHDLIIIPLLLFNCVLSIIYAYHMLNVLADDYKHDDYFFKYVFAEYVSKKDCKPTFPDYHQIKCEEN